MKLPDIPRAATTNIGLMAEKLIFERDFSVVGALLDELKIQDRHEDACHLTQHLGSILARKMIPGLWKGESWNDAQCYLLLVLWFDIFDMNASLAALDVLFKESEKNVGTTADWTTANQYIAGEAIPAGSLVRLDSDGRVVPFTSPVVGAGMSEAARAIMNAVESSERDHEEILRQIQADLDGMDMKDR